MIAPVVTLMYKRASDDKYIERTIMVARRGAATLLRVPHPSTNKLTRALIYKGSVMWNDLLTKTSKARSFLIFKNACRARLVIQAQPSTARIEHNLLNAPPPTTT